MPKGTKLRFALITEDVLEKLRPNPEPTVPIRNAVKEVLSEVMAELNINQMIEDKLVELLERRGIASSQNTSPGGCCSMTGLALTKKSSSLAVPMCSMSSEPPRPSEKRKRHKIQEHPLLPSATHVATKTGKIKSQTTCTQPTHREVTFALQDTASTHRDADAAAKSRDAAATYRDRLNRTQRKNTASTHRDAGASQRDIAALYREITSKMGRAELKPSYRKSRPYGEEQEFVNPKLLRKKLNEN
ncbi:uncharacterized protein [Drosophila pseudoobscura]|uniref:Uncharacterized protein n=1 Tax=Drosophila pseudoobscura pseudoobscura TaxID=46245 RepID=A0A6I8UGH7_DROPS|nr:uncharacterized protein LOC4814774 [Drosophila pseudoobscura]